jgi:hypothetical protein
MGLGGKANGPNLFKWCKGQPTTRPARVGCLAGGAQRSVAHNARNGTWQRRPLDQKLIARLWLVVTVGGEERAAPAR